MFDCKWYYIICLDKILDFYDWLENYARCLSNQVSTPQTRNWWRLWQSNAAVTLLLPPGLFDNNR